MSSNGNKCAVASSVASGSQVIALAAHSLEGWTAALARERLVGGGAVVPDVGALQEVLAAHRCLAFGASRLSLRIGGGKEEDGGDERCEVEAHG